MRAENTLILFTKTPQICRVKTRMHPHLSHRECLYLHSNLTSHAINQFKSNNHFKLIIYTTDIYKSLHLYPRDIIIKQQSGINLGLKMNNAIKQEIKNTRRVVLIGSDFLTLDINYVISAFRSLSKINDIVIGPTLDGGYGLIGMQKHNDSLFENIPWGTSDVFEKTISTAYKHGRKVNILDKISDVDTIEDLIQSKQLDILPEWGDSLVQNHAIN